MSEQGHRYDDDRWGAEEGVTVARIGDRVFIFDGKAQTTLSLSVEDARDLRNTLNGVLPTGASWSVDELPTSDEVYALLDPEHGERQTA